MALTTNENHDKIWAIIRDAMNNAISINDAVAKIKGLQDGTELTEENYEMADNVNPNKADENKTEEDKLQEQSIKNEQAFASVANPGEGADADVNDTIGTDPADDTSTLGVVPEKTTEDGAKAKPASEGNEVAPAVEEDTAQENETKTLSKRQQKKQAAREKAEAENTENNK